MPSTHIEVAGNAHQGTTPPFTLLGFAIRWSGPTSIAADAPNPTRQELESMVGILQPVLLCRLLEPIRLHVPALNANDVILRDPRVFLGLAAIPPVSSDISRIRDIIMEHELADCAPCRATTLRTSAPLLYSVEYLIRAVLTPQAPLPELYKAIEAIQRAMGGRRALASIGIEKGYVDFIMSRANISTDDQRHAPIDPASILPTPTSELRECVVRTREIIVRYAGSL